MTGDMMFTPMYAYVNNYEFRQPPPPYSPVGFHRDKVFCADDLAFKFETGVEPH